MNNNQDNIKPEREAREWLSQQDHILKGIAGGDGEGSYGAAALEFVNRLYSMGASRVVAKDIQKITGIAVERYCGRLGSNADAIELTDKLMVDLPNTTKERRQIFDVFEELFGEGFGEAEDQGQTSLFFWWP